MKKIWLSKSFYKKYKTAAYISLFALLPGFYMLYYFYNSYTYYQATGVSFFDFISDKFHDRLLILFLAVTSIIAFIYFWSRKTLIYELKIDTYLEIIKDKNKCVKVLNRIKIKYLRGKKTILHEEESKSDFIDNLNKLIGFREEKIHYTGKTHRKVELTVSGSNTIGDRLGTPLNIATVKTQDMVRYNVFAVYSDNSEFFLGQGTLRAHKYEEFFKEIPIL